MRDAPAASVIIPVLNGAATLGDLLAALKSQAGVPGPFEILVVDNGSADRTVEIARSHGIQLLNQPVRGPSAARNLGLRQARAEVVVFTDADTIPSRRWLAALLATFDDPQTILATGPIHGWQPSTAAEQFVCCRQVFDCEATARHPRHPFAHGMNVAVRRAAALEIGGWDETMPSGEDVDFSLRLRKRFGSDIRFAAQAVLFHKHRCTDEALWKQARWHGAGYALVRKRHADLMPWHPFKTGVVYASLIMLDAAAPFIELCRRTRLFSGQRAQFERYHRLWMRHFWGGFFEEWRKRPV
jgi:glycosyltransferase involved in cell wall biosynthesis